MNPFSGFLSGTGRSALLTAAIVSSAFGQSATGLIEGRIQDSTSGKNLQGAIIRVVGQDGLRAESLRDGTFTLRNVPVGTYEVEVSYFGMAPRKVSTSVVATGTPARIDVDMGVAPDVVTMDTITVEADATGQARATNQQRVAQSMMNVTSEEQLGSMTDNNIATALQRLPGLSANADTFSEIPRFVNIRGFNADLNSVQLNGSRLPTSGSGRGATPGAGDTARAFALDDIPGNAVTSVEVIKAPTPDKDGDTVGGIVNLVTKSAFDRTGRSIEFQTGFDYIELREKIVPNFSVGFSDLFRDKTVGIRVDFSYAKGDEGFDNIDYDSRPSPARLPSNSYLNLPSGKLVQFHEDTEYNNYFIERDRYGLSSSLDFKLSDTTTLYFKPVVTKEDRVEDDRRFHKIMDNRHSRNLGRGEFFSSTGVPNAAAFSAFNAAQTLNADGSNLAAATFIYPNIGQAVRTGPAPTFDDFSKPDFQSPAQFRTLTSLSETAATTSTLPNGTGRGRAGYFQAVNERDIQFYSLDLGGKTTINEANLTYGYFNSTAKKDEDSESARFYRNGIQWQYERSDVTRPQYNPVSGFPDPYALPANQLSTTPDRFTQVNSNTSENTGGGSITAVQRETEETVNQGHLDFETPFPNSTGILGKLKTGLKYRTMERSFDQNQQFYNLNTTAAYNSFNFASYLKPNNNTVADFPMPYYPDAKRLVAAGRAGADGLTRHYGNASNSLQASSLNADYEASEDTLAGYLMGTFDLGSKLQLTTGFRVEHNWFEASVPVLDTANFPLLNRAPNFSTSENDYTVVLPGLHLRYEATRNLVFRGAYTETYGRPSFTELIGTAVLNEVDNTLTIGNPDLDPFTSKNYDISVEYFGNSTYVQLALFYKDVSNFVNETTRTIDGPTTFNGVNLADATTYNVTTFSNEDKATNRGVELASRYKFIHMPEPFNGLYLDGSLTYTDSYARYSDRPGEKLPTYGASEWLYNIGLGYDRGRYAAQLSYRYRSPYLEGLDSIDRQNRDSGSGPDARDDWWGETHYWNWESSYQVTKNFKVYLNVSNLFEFTNVGYQSPPENNYPEDSYWHQRRWSFGVKGTF